MSGKGFLKPKDDDFIPWTEDKLDVDAQKDTTFVYNSTPSLGLAAQRQKLPIFKTRDHILYMLEKFQVVIIVGETGSGKSTQIPQYLVEAGWCLEEGQMIGITEPRRVAATTLAARVAEEKHCPMGELVGYSIRFDEWFDRAKTKIKYMTEGILVREMMGDPLLKSYSVIMLDEVHERTAQIDIIMGLMKKILRKRRDLRVIISSATVDAEYIRDFFNGNRTKDVTKDTASIMSISGSNFSVEVFYLNEPCPNYVQGAVETVLKLHEREPPGDILVFLTGMDEVDHCVSLLKERTSDKHSKHGLKIWPLPMYGSLPPQDQLKVFRPSLRGYRKIVVATNIAETSITIEGIVYVIDSGFVKLKWYNADTNVDALIVTEISQASAEQRAGRAGRTRPGQCYRLCREEDFQKLPLNTPPEMQRTDLSTAVLQLKALGIDNVVRFEFPSAPPSKNLMSSLELLYALGAIDDNGHLTKPLGENMSELPIHPTLSKMLFSSAKFKCSREIAAIIAMLQIENIFIKPPGGQAGNRARVMKRKFEVAEGDHLTLLNVFNTYLKQKQWDIKLWCQQHFLKYKGLKRAEQLFEQLIRTLKRYDVPIQYSSDMDEIRRCIVSGLFPNAAYYHMSGSYRTIRGDIPLSVHPTSVLYTLKQPSWVVFTELAHSKKVHMKDITVIDPTWLEILAPHYYQKTTLQRSH